MSMEISNNYNSYAASGSYTTGSNSYAVRKDSYATGSTKQASESGKADGTTKNNGVTTSTVELKTSKPGVTKREQINTGYKNINDYSRYLQSKYSYMNTGKTSMSGIPTTVTVSPAFLEQCNKDPEKAKYLEENLAALPDCAEYARTHSLGTLTSLSYQFDANGNITIISSSTNDPDGKIARENEKRRAQEQKDKEKKITEKRAKEKAEEKKAAKRRAEKEQTEKRLEKTDTDEISISITGNSVESITKAAVSAFSGEPNTGVAGFDAKA